MTGIYVRVKRNNKFENVEFELLTDKEMSDFITIKQEQKLDGWSWVMVLAQYLRDTILPMMNGLIEDGIISEEEK